MAINLAELKVSAADIPPRILIYGPEGIGKNTLSLEFPKPFTFDLERGMPPGHPHATEDDIPNFAMLLEAIGDLIEQDHDFKTIIFDSLDKIQQLIFEDLCEQNNWKSIETPGYGAGYKMAVEKWQELIRAIGYLNRTRNVAIIFLAHSDIGRFDDPNTSSYSKYGLRINDKAAGVVKDDADAILFINQEASISKQEVGMKKEVVKAGGSGDRWIRAEARPAFAAKNRFGIPDKFKYERGKGYALLAKYLPAMDSPPTAAVEAEEQSIEQPGDNEA